MQEAECATDNNNNGQSRGSLKSGNHHWLVTSPEAPRPRVPTPCEGAEASWALASPYTLRLPCSSHHPPQPHIYLPIQHRRPLSSTLFSSITSSQSTRGRCCKIDQPLKGRNPPASQSPVLPVLLSLPEYLPSPVPSPTFVAPWHSQASFPFWSA